MKEKEVTFVLWRERNELLESNCDEMITMSLSYVSIISIAYLFYQLTKRMSLYTLSFGIQRDKIYPYKFKNELNT